MTVVPIKLNNLLFVIAAKPPDKSLAVVLITFEFDIIMTEKSFSTYMVPPFYNEKLSLIND